jgi:hypothetical protein
VLALGLKRAPQDIRLARGWEILIDDRGEHFLLTPTTERASAFLKTHGGPLTWALGAAVVERERGTALIEGAIGAGLNVIFHPVARSA